MYLLSKISSQRGIIVDRGVAKYNKEVSFFIGVKGGNINSKTR
jgi:hypothetical protein